MHAKLRIHKTVTVGASLYGLIYDMLTDIVFPMFCHLYGLIYNMLTDIVFPMFCHSKKL